MCSSLARCALTVLPLAALCPAGSSPEARGTTVVIPLYDIVPDCSLHCIDTFIDSDYPSDVCSRRSDINCLCRTGTSSGLTFGEAALRCVLSFCRQKVDSSLGVYNICNSVDGALPQSGALPIARPTITATVAPVSSQAATTSPIGGSESLASVHSTMTGDTQTAITSSSSKSSATKTSHTASYKSHTTTPARPSHSPVSTNSLNSGVIIGISVASGASVSFIIGAVLFLCCRRLRGSRQGKQRSRFFDTGRNMSEPPGFILPPTRHPSPGPGSYLDAENSGWGNRRLMAPSSPRSHSRGPTMESNHASLKGREEQTQIGIAISSNSELATPSRSQTSQRTLSGLLPDKPELCAEPLRVSRRTSCRPNSAEALPEEAAPARRRRSIVGSVNDWTDWPGSSIQGRGSSPCNGMRMLGLPSNPRALIHGFGGADRTLPSKVGPGQRMNPALANRGRLQSRHDATALQNTSYLEDHEYSPGSGDATCRRDFDQALFDSVTARYPNSGLEPVDANLYRQAMRCARNSGCLPLTPIVEGRASANNALWAANRDCFSNNLPETDSAVWMGPANEIVSRPRIVRGDDIKRVPIQKGKPQPRELKVPYSPDDYWLAHHRGHRAPGIAGKSPRSRRSNKRMYSREEMRVLNATKPLPPLEHSLTPSKGERI